MYMDYIIKNVDVSSFLGLDHLGFSAWLSASSAPGLRKPRFNLAAAMGGSIPSNPETTPGMDGKGRL